MKSHPVDRIALIFGLLFTLAGTAIITGVGLLIVVTLGVRQFRASRPPADAISDEI